MRRIKTDPDTNHFRFNNMNLDLSVIVPFFNEEECIQRLYEAVTDVLAQTPNSYEILLVDDGSTDNTFAQAELIAFADPRVKVIKFRKNYGQTPAMAAGIDLAQGRILITMDGDLQNDPADIPLLLGKIDEGFDIVVGWRHMRQDKLITRRIPSIVANWLIGKVTGVPIKDNGCSLKAYRADLVKYIPLYAEMHRFIPAMASIAGARVAEVKVRHHAREFGTSKYGLSRIYKVLIDLLAIKTLISFASKPFTWFATLSIPFLILSAILLTTEFVNTISNDLDTSLPIAGTGLLFGALAIFLLGAGILAELIYFYGTFRIEKLYMHTSSTKTSENQVEVS